MLKIYLSKSVKKWFDNEKNLLNNELLDAAEDIARGVFDANLGGDIYKKRIASKNNRGKSSGARLLIAYKKGRDLFFMYAFNKNEQDNITAKERLVLKERAKLYFNMSEVSLKKAVKAKLFFEIRRK